MDGILVIDKPEGWTSHDVVARIRRILKTKRVGHTGTLDPFATGVLVLLIGKATRLAQFLDKDEKEYEAVVQFGHETDTGDRTGKPRSSKISPLEVDRRELERIVAEFIGDIDQTPPMFSAKKLDGRRLYELAREGKEVERKPVKVTVSDTQVLPSQISETTASLRIVCSAGTYIRTLAEDIGRRLGTGAHLTKLRRTRAGRFGLGQSVTVADLESSDLPVGFVLPIEQAVQHLPQMILTDDRIEKTRNGLATRVSDIRFSDGASIRMIDKERRLIAIGKYNAIAAEVKPRLVLA